MKFKKSLSLLLSAVMVAGCATVAVTAAESDSESVGYSNQSFLETEAGQAKNTNDWLPPHGKPGLQKRTRLKSNSITPAPTTRQAQAPSANTT